MYELHKQTTTTVHVCILVAHVIFGIACIETMSL